LRQVRYLPRCLVYPFMLICPSNIKLFQSYNSQPFRMLLYVGVHKMETNLILLGQINIKGYTRHLGKYLTCLNGSYGLERVIQGLNELKPVFRKRSSCSNRIIVSLSVCYCMSEFTKWKQGLAEK
jgi:hypothetical protein